MRAFILKLSLTLLLVVFLSVRFAFNFLCLARHPSAILDETASHESTVVSMILRIFLEELTFDLTGYTHTKATTQYVAKCRGTHILSNF